MDVSPNNLEFTGMYIWIMFGLIGWQNIEGKN